METRGTPRPYLKVINILSPQAVLWARYDYFHAQMMNKAQKLSGQVRVAQGW